MKVLTIRQTDDVNAVRQSVVFKLCFLACDTVYYKNKLVRQARNWS